MKFAALTALFCSLFLPALCTTVTYDTAYDVSSASLNTVACSNGANGLVSRFPTFGDLPNFPNIGGAPAVAGWNSPNCGKSPVCPQKGFRSDTLCHLGTCWALTYTPPTGKVKKVIHVLAIDTGAKGFNIALEAMNELTEGQAVQLGTVDVVSSQVDASVCGL